MSALKSILLAIELATRQRDELTQAVLRAQRTLGFVNAQMAQLQGYAAETDGRWMDSSGAPRCGELIHHHYQFMDRLQHAIGLQSAVTITTQRQLDAANKALLQAEFRLAGLNQVLKARQNEVLRQQKRREQRQTDEFAAQQHYRNRALRTSGEKHGH